MKKKILILLIILLLTGCKATYNINFDDNKIYDEIEIYENSSTINTANKEQEEEINSLILDWENGYDHYQRELYATDKITGYKYTYDFNYDEYDAMSQLRKCYDDFDFTYNSNNIKLTTSNEFLCGTYYPITEEIIINITSKYKITSNADENENNKHTWIINKNNYKNHPIELTINKNIDYEDISKEHKLSFKQIFVYIIFISLIVILIIRKRRNK